MGLAEQACEGKRQSGIVERMLRELRPIQWIELRFRCEVGR